ncbi:M42 family metallopeptidase [soil metagenome]
MQSYEFFKALIAAPSPSGFEEEARRVWRNEVKTFADSHFTNMHGTEIATVKGRSEKTSLLLMGHIDEIGLIVRYISDDGFLYFAQVGGQDEEVFVSQQVRLLGPKGTIRGIIGKNALHLLDEEERRKKSKLHELFIDIGAKTKAEAEEHAPIGTPGVVGIPEVIELLNERVAGRCVDNKFGAFVCAEVLRNVAARKSELYPTIHAAATVQEETSPDFTGATTAAYRINPTAAIAVDVNHSIDVPSTDKRRFGDAAMGKGAILTIGVRSNNKLADAIKKAATGAGITMQYEYDNGRHGTDADAVTSIRSGIPTISIGNPLRYMHTTVEMTQLSDIQAVIDALVAFIMAIESETDFAP